MGALPFGLEKQIAPNYDPNDPKQNDPKDQWGNLKNAFPPRPDPTIPAPPGPPPSFTDKLVQAMRGFEATRLKLGRGIQSSFIGGRKTDPFINQLPIKRTPDFMGMND